VVRVQQDKLEHQDRRVTKDHLETMVHLVHLGRLDFRDHPVLLDSLEPLVNLDHLEQSDQPAHQGSQDHRVHQDLEETQDNQDQLEILVYPDHKVIRVPKDLPGPMVNQGVQDRLVQ